LISLFILAFELLNRVAAMELVPEALEKHFQPYVERNGLEIQVVLYDYCLVMMDGAGKRLFVHISTSVVTEDLEDRMLYIIDRLSTLDMKVDLVLELMTRIKIPWSDNIQALILKAS
jgi:hypothetical protein